MQRMRAYGTGGSDDTVDVLLTAEINFPESLPQTLRAEAEDRIASLLRREAQRISEIAFVDAQDALAEPAERERIRSADPNRSHVIVQAGTREAVQSGKVDVADAVQVVRGEVEAHGQTLRERGRS